MITEQLHLSIIRHFRPDWGRTTRECETCGGRGHDFDPNKKYDDAVLAIKNARDCPDCNGTGTVFREWETCPACFGNKTVGQASVTQLVPKKPPCSFCRGEGRVPDEAGRAVIAEAVREFSRSKGKGLHWWTGTNETWWDVWRQITADHHLYHPMRKFVRNYQRDPPDFSTLEGCEELKGMLREVRIAYSAEIELLTKQRDDAESDREYMRKLWAERGEEIERLKEEVGRLMSRIEDLEGALEAWEHGL